MEDIHLNVFGYTEPSICVLKMQLCGAAMDETMGNGIELGVKNDFIRGVGCNAKHEIYL